jgi:tetratricopeptide (TPR) repeat protein
MPSCFDRAVRIGGGCHARLGVTAALLVALAGCAGRPGSQSGAGVGDGQQAGVLAVEGGARDVALRGALDRLRELADAARRNPGPAATLPALGTEWGVAPVEQRERHVLSLDDALRQIGTIKATEAEAGDAVVDAAGAQRKYVSGRLRLLDGDVNGALREWEGALVDDPGSPRLAGEVGTLQVRAGRRSTGVATLRTAVESGLRAAEPLRVLAREEHRAGDTERALTLLATAREDRSLERDVVRRRLVEADLGERLADAGYLAAAREALASLSDLEPAGLGQAALTNPDFAELLRRRGQLLVRAGDLGAMLGEWEAASDSYRAAMAAAAVDDGQARLRLAGVSLRAGNPAEAALQVVGSLPGDQLPQPWHAEVARALRGAGEVPGAFARVVSAPVEGEATPTGRVRRAELAAMALPPGDAVALLQEAAAGASAWADRRGVLGALLDVVDARNEGAGTDAKVGARIAALVSVLARDPLAGPECGEALVTHGRDIGAVQKALASKAEGSREAAVLAGALALRLEQPTRGLALVQAAPAGGDVNVRAALTAARCAALVQLGREGEAKAAAREFAGTGPSVALAARVLLAAGDVEAAGAVLAQAAAATDANQDVLALAAQVETQRGRAAQALDLLARAAAIDPDAPAIADARIALLRPGVATGNEEAFAGIVRTMRERDAASPLVRRLVTLDLAQRGLWRQARIEAGGLMDDRGTPRELIEVLASAWQRGGDKRAVENDATRLRELLAARPESPVLAGHLARALVASGKGAEAEELLAKQYAITALDELGRQREGIVRDVLQKPEEAQRLMLARLANRPATFVNQAELAQALVRAGAYREAAGALRSVGIQRATITPAQSAGILNVARLVRAEAVGTASAEEQRGALELLDYVREVQGDGAWPADLAALRVDLLCGNAPEGAGAILDAIDVFAQSVSRGAGGGAGGGGANAATVGKARQDATGRVAQRLAAMEDATPLLRLLEELYVRSQPVSDELGAEWIRMSIIRGDAEDNRRLVMFWQDVERLHMSLAALQIPIEWEGDTIEAVRPEFAYLVANALNGQVREAAAAEVYKLALELNPKQGWSGNNYGYMILERGGDIAEAAKLIEMAHEQLPEEASVADTIGWLRYKQGQMDDQTLADGTVRLGAVTLLERSAAMLGGEENWEILDHLADALWRRNRDEGDRKKAIDSWGLALASIRQEIMMIRMTNEQSPRLADHQRRQREIEAKLQAVKDPAVVHDAVPIAPIGIPAVFTPLPEPGRPGMQPQQQGVDLLMP